MVMIGGDNMPPDRLFLHKIRKKTSYVVVIQTDIC